MKKEFKMTRNIDKRKHSYYENIIENCKVETKQKTVCTSCTHCKYDYTQEKGMLFDEEGPNRVYIRAFKKWQLQPCEHCDKKYIKYLDQYTYLAEQDWYEDELMMRKIDRYLDRWS